MKVAKYFVFVFIIFFSSEIFAQDSVLKNKKIAINQIKTLKSNGAIVVRLNLTKKKADLYRSQGKNKIADKIDEKNTDKIKLLMLTLLDKTFNFCPVYFIESKDYGRVLNGDTSGFFLNQSLKKDSTIVFSATNFLFMDLGPVFDVDIKDQDMEATSKSTAILQNALVLKDSDLKQLNRPFPFFVNFEGVLNDVVDYKSLINDLSEIDANIVDLESYSHYMSKKYGLDEKERFFAEKIFIFNLSLHKFFLNTNTPKD